MRSARLHSPRSTHAAYCSVVTSLTSMQKVESLTLWAGLQIGKSVSSEPMKKLDPGTVAIPSGQVGGAAAALALAFGAASEAAAVAEVAAPLPWPTKKNAA